MAVSSLAVSRGESWFYVRLAGLFAAITLLGFAPTYWLPLASGRLESGAPILHFHAFLFAAWPLLFFVQTWLAATSRLKWHRSVGLFGAAAAIVMLVSGLWVTGYSINVQTALGYPVGARAIAITSFTKILFFAACVALAIIYVKRSDVHKRLMVLAMLPLVQTAIPRIMYASLMPPGSPQRPGLGEPASLLVGIPAAVAIDVLLVTVIWLDRRATGRLHPVYLIGGASFVTLQIVRIPLSTSDVWQRIAGWLASFTGA